MKKRSLVFGVLLVLFLALPASATPLVLTFEGLGNNEQILNYYNGGLGGSGSGPGPNYGITFGIDALSNVATSGGGTGVFTNAPTMPTVLFFFIFGGSDAVMNVPAGFTTGLSFFYSSFATGSVEVYDGLNGTGNQLTSIALSPTPTPWNVFVPIGAGFAGTAESVVFSHALGSFFFDNVTLGSSTPTVPLPPTVWLLGSGLLGLVGFRKKFRR
jgi:hypothetical protein